MFLYLHLFISFSPFPERSDALLSTNENELNIEASGSLGMYLSDSICRPTFPNNTLISDRKYDWCSNIGNDESDKPWISYQIPHKSMKLNSYSVRNGCCDYLCCCNTKNGKPIGSYCCCRLYSFSLLGSNDNKTWTILHRIEKDANIKRCEIKSYDIKTENSFNFIKFVMDQETPGCPRCMQVNQIELYGKLFDSQYPLNTYNNYNNNEEVDDSISIIGKVKH